MKTYRLVLWYPSIQIDSFGPIKPSVIYGIEASTYKHHTFRRFNSISKGVDHFKLTTDDAEIILPFTEEFKS